MKRKTSKTVKAGKEAGKAAKPGAVVAAPAASNGTTAGNGAPADTDGKPKANDAGARAIFARDAEVGRRYLSKFGIPVTVRAKLNGGRVRLLVETIKTEIDVLPDVILRRFNEAQIDPDAMRLARHYGVNGRDGLTPRVATRDGSISSIIDPLLLAGGKTVNEVAVVLAKAAKAGHLKLSDGYVPRYVHARIHYLRSHGFKVEKDGQKRVKVTAPPCGSARGAR